MGVARARDTEHVTVDEIRRVGTVGAVGEKNGCWKALVRFQPPKTSEVSCRTRRHDDVVFHYTVECGPAVHAPTPIPQIQVSAKKSVVRVFTSPCMVHTHT